MAASAQAAAKAPTRLAIATLAVGARTRCGFVRWCQGAARLRDSLLSPSWVTDLVALRWDESALGSVAATQGAAARRADPRRRGAHFPTVADGRDCPGLVEVVLPAELESVCWSCVRRLRERGAVPGRTISAALRSQVLYLLKWHIFGMVSYDLVFFVDLDADPLSASMQSAARVGALWRAVVPRLLDRSSTVRLVATADSMSPVHAGVFVARPLASLYARGLATIHACEWNHTHGWNLVGRPRSLAHFLPRHLNGVTIGGDIGAVQQPMSTDGFRNDDWSFWGASVEQGLFWYELFLRRGGAGAGVGAPAQLGAYSRWSTPHKISHEWGGDDKPWEGLHVGASSLSKLAVRLRYLMSVDLVDGGGNGTSACAARLWRVRRRIEDDPRFDAVWHRMSAMVLPIFSVF